MNYFRLPSRKLARLTALILCLPSITEAASYLQDTTIRAEPATIPRAVQFDFTARTNGRSYRLMVSVPNPSDTKRKFPVVYVLDGYWYFAAAARTVPADPGDFLEPAIVVGIGYQTDDFNEIIRLRTFDLTPTPMSSSRIKAEGGTGGVDSFISTILDEVRPFIESRYPVDRDRQAIFGMSMGGLTVLRTLFRHPEAFQTYLACSPAIYVNARAVLGDEGAFSLVARTGPRRMRLLITSAANEQYRGTDPTLVADDTRFVDNATELAQRLLVLNPTTFKVRRVVFPDENHKSVALASLGRALTFALGPESH
jgi:uncharacterized protein